MHPLDCRYIVNTLPLLQTKFIPIIISLGPELVKPRAHATFITISVALPTDSHFFAPS